MSADELNKDEKQDIVMEEPKSMEQQVTEAAVRLVNAQRDFAAVRNEKVANDYESRKLYAVKHALATFEVTEAYKALDELIS